MKYINERGKSKKRIYIIFFEIIARLVLYFFRHKNSIASFFDHISSLKMNSEDSQDR